MGRGEKEKKNNMEEDTIRACLDGERGRLG